MADKRIEHFDPGALGAYRGHSTVHDDGTIDHYENDGSLTAMITDDGPRTGRSIIGKDGVVTHYGPGLLDGPRGYSKIPKKEQRVTNTGAGGGGGGGDGFGGLIFSLILCVIFLILGVMSLPFLHDPNSGLPVRSISSRKRGFLTALFATLSFVFFCAAFKAAINPALLLVSLVFFLFALYIDRNSIKSKPRHE
jgi:hypothetical protein